MIYEVLIIGIRTGARWVEVPYDVFRSWTGPRKANGKLVEGIRFAAIPQKVLVQ